MKPIKLKYGPYSPSRLDAGTCGYAFFKQYVDPKWREVFKTENLPQARGSVVHEVLEHLTAAMIENPEVVFSQEQVRKWIVESISRHPAAYQATDEILEMAKNYIERPPKLLTKNAEIELRIGIRAVKDESGKIHFEDCSYDDEDALFRGRSDVLLISDDEVYGLIYDHKTQPNIEEADTFQLGCYAWSVKKQYPFLKEIHTILNFVRYGYYSDPITWTEEGLAKIEDEILTRIAQIESRESWDPIPHKNCQYCAFIAQCPIMKEYVSVDMQTGDVVVKPDNLKILGDTHKAVRLAGFLNVLEETVGIAKKNVREHVKKSGAPIAIPGKVYEYRPESGINWKKVNSPEMRKKTYEIFEKHGVDPRQYMSFNQSVSKDIWLLGNEALIKELAEIFPRKTTTKFGGYKG